MSFKREGDNEALLHNLKMRRVGELLSEHIPEDEAKLLSNGRLTCLICSHRPIFDTCAVLANHRKGKKHIVELGKFLQHKRELALKKLKSDHLQYLYDNEIINTGSTRKSQSRFSRKPIISIPTLHGDPTEVNSKPQYMPSPSSQVRHYLKELQRKRALQKTVEKCRENYMLQSSVVPQNSGSNPNSLPNSVHDHKKATNSEDSKRDLQLRMSGWIKSSEGKWVKDPAAEFDSDEESPEESVQSENVNP
ncbi:hypothetical protein R5R35_005914 [Gryllus longicercus]|uniref:Sodium channel modifier 1 n=1 Tax=Gryllus longicercus TaxID=2509291 RepID=A0AAN9VSJ2_9ORTH